MWIAPIVVFRLQLEKYVVNCRSVHTVATIVKIAGVDILTVIQEMQQRIQQLESVIHEYALMPGGPLYWQAKWDFESRSVDTR